MGYFGGAGIREAAGVNGGRAETCFVSVKGERWLAMAEVAS